MLCERFALDEEQKVLFSHLIDLYIRSENRNIVCTGNFMTASECAGAEKLLAAAGCRNYFLYGGYDGAERRCAVFPTDYCGESEIMESPELADMIYVVADVNKFDIGKADFSHRDCLGSLMALGIEREMLGDMIAEGGKAVIIAKRQIAGYIKDNLSKIGKYPVNVTLHDKYEIVETKDYETGSDTVASMRLDAVIASVFKMSRSGAAEAISNGMAAVNGITSTKPDVSVKDGDKLSLRGKGRVVIEKNNGVSKKGRIRFLYKKYR